MKQFFLSTLLMIFVFGAVIGQVRYYNTYDHTGAFTNTDLYPRSTNYELLNNGNALIAGIKEFGNNQSYYLDIKMIDTDGELVWSRRVNMGLEFNINYSNRFQVADILEAYDGYVFALNKRFHNGNNDHYASVSYIIKISLDGQQILWSRSVTDIDDSNFIDPGHIQISQIINSQPGRYAFVGTVGLFNNIGGNVNIVDNKVVYGEINAATGQLIWNRRVTLIENLGLQGLSIYYRTEGENLFYIGARLTEAGGGGFPLETVLINADVNGTINWARRYAEVFALSMPFGYLPIVDNYPSNTVQNQLAFIGQNAANNDFIVIDNR